MTIMRYQVAVIGGGPAGYTAAVAAAKAGMSVVLFERQSVGGVCLNEGCIPTKTLLYSAKTLDAARQAQKYGIGVDNVSADLVRIQARKQKVVRKLVLGIKSMLSAAGVQLVTGEAHIEGPNTVTCGGQTYEADNLLLCTGSQTVMPPLPGLDTVDCWTHREALQCTSAPQSLCIVGGGVIGMEFASFFCSLGTKVTVIEMAEEVLPGLDAELCALLRDGYARKGVDFLTGTRVTALRPMSDGGVEADYERQDGTGKLRAEKLLVCVGRRPVTQGWGLENLHLRLTDRGNIIVDRQLRTSQPNVYAVGDLNGVSMLAHTAVREAEVAVASMAGKDEYMSYRAIPSVVYTNPEIAGVGQTESALQKRGTAYRALKLPMTFSGRFVAENEGQTGLCKLLIGSDNRLLGAHVLGNPASEIITLAAMAMEAGLTVDQWKRVVFPHPTVGEIFREVLS